MPEQSDSGGTLGEWYLSNADGDLLTYHQGLRHGHRIGQAFFNALSDSDQARIVSTLHDPFYGNTSGDVERAIEFLTRREPATRPDDMTVAEERAAGCDCGSIDGGHPGDCAMFKPLSRPGTPGGESDG